MLQMISVEIKLMTNLNMRLMIENGIRGGRCETMYYHAKANNKFVNPNSNNRKESSIISLDVNSLYASAMCYELKHGEIKLDYNVSKYTNQHILNLNPYGEYLFVFVADIHYPKKFHDRGFEFPILCAQSIPQNHQVKTLMSTFYDKRNYTLHM